ncbi:MAG: Gfo/Idh/MocA family oxidoreductase [Chitinophagaceae bacterium]|jgi:predicted dehydrogenase|nr:Gfo/Idh/MocA family oxidoreductase [Chitinophagaceae bacterium]
MKNSRRKFIKESGILAIGGIGLSAMNYKNIIGANDRIIVGVMGVNGRGAGMAANFARQKNTEVKFICDVEQNALAKGINAVRKAVSKEPAAIKDFRTILSDKDLDAMYLAPPDHWHAPAAILCCAAGKHVYVEKPLSHNPYEGELAVKAARKYNRIVQMGSQRRSAPVLTQGIKELHDGVIGKTYMAKTWYTNTRPSIGIGKKVAVPPNLDFNLWQGPAPRKPYQDNLIHYNWHWFWHWGTGEALNNGTHEIDVARWGLNADYPFRVHSVGGRYCFTDDWETPDTQLITWDSDKGCVIWEGRSCNGTLVEGEDRGVIFYGENGSLSTGGNSYVIRDNKNKIVKEVKSDVVMDGRDPSSPSADLDNLHIANFLKCVREGGIPNADVEVGRKSTLWVQLGNIAQRVGSSIDIDTNGHIKNNNAAQKLWSRTYEPGWEPVI